MKHVLNLLCVVAYVAAEAPYPANGWKPAGPAFELPTVQTTKQFNQTLTRNIPATKYGPPQSTQEQSRQYGTPQIDYEASGQFASRTEQQIPPNRVPETKYGQPQSSQEQSRQYGVPKIDYETSAQSASRTSQQTPSNLKPATNYGPPQRTQEQSSQYGTPQQPATNYGQPQSIQESSRQYGAPQVQYEASGQSGARTSQQAQFNGVPASKYGQPESIQKQSRQYGAPQVQYEASGQSGSRISQGTQFNQVPETKYGQPEQSRQYGAPQILSEASGQSESKSSQGTQSNQIPETKYGQPELSRQYGAPQVLYEASGVSGLRTLQQTQFNRVPATKYGQPEGSQEQSRQYGAPQYEASGSRTSQRTEFNRVPDTKYGQPQSIQEQSRQYGPPQVSGQSGSRTSQKTQFNRAPEANYGQPQTQSIQPATKYGPPPNSQDLSRQYGTPQIQNETPGQSGSQTIYQIPIYRYSPPQTKFRLIPNDAQAQRFNQPPNQYTAANYNQQIQRQELIYIPPSQQISIPQIQRPYLVQDNSFLRQQRLPYLYAPPQSFRQAERQAEAPYPNQISPVQTVRQVDFTNINEQALPYQYLSPQTFRSTESEAQITNEYLPSEDSTKSLQEVQYGVPQVQTHISNLGSSPVPQPPATQYLPSVRSANFKTPAPQENRYAQQTFRNQNNAKQLSLSKDPTIYNEELRVASDYDDYKTIVLTKEEEEDVNRKYGRPETTTPVSKRKRTRKSKPRESTTPTPVTSDEEDFAEVPSGPNVSVGTAVANGQYYLLQPNDRLQIASAAQQGEEAKINGFSTNFVYQLGQPINVIPLRK